MRKAPENVESADVPENPHGHKEEHTAADSAIHENGVVDLLTAMKAMITSVIEAESERIGMLASLIGRIEDLLRSPRSLDELIAQLPPDIRAVQLTGGRRLEQHAAPGIDPVPAALHRLAARLSPAELHVCTLLSRNKSTKEIADVLCTSVHTVEIHRRRIRRKLALGPRANLVAYLIVTVAQDLPGELRGTFTDQVVSAAGADRPGYCFADRQPLVPRRRMRIGQRCHYIIYIET